MDKLTVLKDLKSSRTSLGNGVFCIFDRDEESKIAKELHKEGVLERIRHRNVINKQKPFNLSYTVYKEVTQ